MNPSPSSTTLIRFGGQLLRCKRPRSLPRLEENPQELSLVCRWLAVLCIPSTSICVTCASSMARRDGSPLDEGAVMICCDMCICRQYLRNFCGKTIPGEQGSCHPRRQPLRVGPWPRPGPLVAGPMSGLHGCDVVYRVSFSPFFICTFPLRSHLMYVCTLCYSLCMRFVLDLVG